MNVINLKEVSGKDIPPFTHSIITFRLPRPMSNQTRKNIKKIIQKRITNPPLHGGVCVDQGSHVLITLDGYISIWIAAMMRAYGVKYSFAIHKGFNWNIIPKELRRKAYFYTNKAESVISISPNPTLAIEITKSLWALHDIKTYERWFKRNIKQNYSKYLPILCRNATVASIDIPLVHCVPDSKEVKHPMREIVLKYTPRTAVRYITINLLALQEPKQQLSQFKKVWEKITDEIPF